MASTDPSSPSLSSYLWSFVVPVSYNDAPEEKDTKSDEKDKPADDKKEDSDKKDEGDKKEGKSKEGEEAKEEPEEDEPEDPYPGLQEDCAQSKPCVGFTKHFEHCVEKIGKGEGYKHEDCVEEFKMHCVDSCVAPKIFTKLV